MKKSKEGLNKATARVKSYQYKLSVSKSKCDTISERCDHLESVVQGLNKDVISLKQSLQHSENNYERLFERLQELESHVFETKEHQKKYLDSVRACCIELLSLNVGIKMWNLLLDLFSSILRLKNCHISLPLLGCFLR